MCLEDQRPKQAYCDSDRFQVSPLGVTVYSEGKCSLCDRLYQENWLEQVTTKKGQLNWSIASLCLELVAKMAKGIGMTIRKGIVVPFLPCLVAFWGFHPYMFFHFFLLLL